MARKVGRGAAALAALGLIGASLATGAPAAKAADTDTTTPIKHVVVIFPENISFDHYFGTYPQAANISGEKLQGGDVEAAPFTAKPGTPTPDNLTKNDLLGAKNPNAVKPFRLTPGQAVTCDQNHNYANEQAALNGTKADKYVESVSKDKCASSTQHLYEANGMTMGYYDGNTVAAMWNYAQRFALNDNSWSTVFGPSTPGALNLIAGQTGHATSYDRDGKKLDKPDSYAIQSPDASGVGTITNDPDPLYDDCSNGNDASGFNALAAVDAPNIGDKLNAKGVSWGWFQGGFKPSSRTADGKAICHTARKDVAGDVSDDYSAHHNPFAYFKSTSNQHHTEPASVAEVGHDGPANHNYDVSDFDAALAAGNLPAVSFMKAGQAEDGHPGYSDPIDEQRFITREINALMKAPTWSSTAIVIAYDDSDGWYDHAVPTILNGSKDTKLDKEICTSAATAGSPLGGLMDRCGPGTRQPLLVISPYAKQNVIDHTATEQTSVLKFIEDNWSTGRMGGSAFDERANSLTSMFDFGAAPDTTPLFLNEDNGSVADSADAVRTVAVTTQTNPTKPRQTPTASAPASSSAAAPSSAAATSASATAAPAPAPAKSGSWVPWVIGGVVVLALLGLLGWLLSRRRGARTEAEPVGKTDTKPGTETVVKPAPAKPVERDGSRPATEAEERGGATSTEEHPHDES